MPSGLSHLNSLDRFISYTGGVSLVFVISCFEEISKLNANSLDPDQTPHIAASDLGLRCLPMSLLWDARRKGVRLPRPFIQSSLFISGKYVRKVKIMTKDKLWLQLHFCHNCPSKYIFWEHRTCSLGSGAPWKDIAFLLLMLILYKLCCRNN